MAKTSLRTRRVGIIYDSSFLMSDSCCSVRLFVTAAIERMDDSVRLCNGELSTEYDEGVGLLQTIFCFVSLPVRLPFLLYKRIQSGTERKSLARFARNLDVAEVVPLQVEEEVGRLLADAEKGESARRARGTVAELIEGGAVQVDVSKRTLDLYGERVSAGPLSCDSVTDKAIVGYALMMLDGQWDIALIATNDGGIRYDVSRLPEMGQRIRCIRPLEIEDFDETVDSLAGLLSEVSRDVGGRVEVHASV